MSVILSPPILFFILGMLATLLRTGLKIPHPIPKLLSLYLLFAIGFRGGIELEHSGITAEVALTIGAAIGMALAVPTWSFFILKRKLSIFDAGAVAATYGSVSAVTFITAQAVLDEAGIAHSGSMVAAMALMESPAIVVAVILIRKFSSGTATSTAWRKLLHESFLNGPVFLLLGSLGVGLLTGPRGDALLRPFYHDVFTGVLCFFLLDLGLLAARRLGDLREAGVFGVGFALVAPIVHASLGLVIAHLLGLDRGDALLFTMLCGSASYIAVPAAIRLVVPQASAGLYIPMALGITFPFNVAVGIPLFFTIISALWRT